jgi:signal transduction histidine kinase
LPIRAPKEHDLLERSFQELAALYRHSSVGRRCLGIVHRMNTPLQVISFQVDLLEQKAQEELDLIAATPHLTADPLTTLNLYRQAKLSQLRRELKRLQGLVQTLVQEGAHEATEEMIPLDLNRVFRRELDLYQSQPFVKNQVTIVCQFQDDLPVISGYYIDFSQSFRNLIDNSLEAMHGREPKHLTVVTACRDRRIVVRVGDTGGGIAPAALPLIFQPFFTTKKTLNGTRAGLGLFMVRRLLSPYQGAIRVDSGPGGTWVTVELPVG